MGLVNHATLQMGNFLMMRHQVNVELVGYPKNKSSALYDDQGAYASQSIGHP